MRVGTIVSLAASAALGIGALVVARMWLPVHTAAATPHVAPVEPGVPVVLAAAPIAYGTKLEAKELMLAKMPANVAPQGAFASIDEVMKQDSGGAPVALVAMQPKEPILAAKLSGPGARATLSALIGEGLRAYTIGVTEVAGGGGHVMPGDRVDVVLTRDISSQGAVDGGARGAKLLSQVVLQNVRVLGMDLNVDPTSTHPSVAHTATLEVSVEDAERLSLAAQAGTMSLALRREGSAEVKPVRPVQTSDLGAAGAASPTGARLGGRSGGARRGAEPSTATAVIVVHGEHRDRVDVPAERLRAGA
jgi:pilus assembly protein CpaB